MHNFSYRIEGAWPAVWLSIHFSWRKFKKNTDYHTEMDAHVCQIWMVKTVFPKLQEIGEKCVAVLDCATYHTVLTQDTEPLKLKWN